MFILKENLFKWISGRPLIHGSLLSVIGNGVGRIGGLAATILIAAKYGADIQTDAFYTVFAVVAFFFNFFQGTLDLSFIPVYSEARCGSISESTRFLGSVFLCIVILAMALTVIIDLLVYYLAPFLLPNQTEDFVLVVVRLTWEMSPVIIGMVISALFISLLNAERFFMAAGLMSFFPSAGIIVFVLLLHSAWNVHALSRGLFFGTLLQACAVYLFSRRKGFELEFGPRSPFLSKVLKMASLQAVALFLLLIMPVLDRVIVSYFLQRGNVTAIENATRLCQIPWALATAGYINVFHSWWSRKSSEGDFTFVDTSFKKLFALSCLVFIPASLLLFFAALPIVKVLFGHGRYPDIAIIATSDVFAYLSLGYWAFMLRSTFIRFYSARQNAKVVTKAAIWDFAVHFLLVLLFIQRIGIAIIGIATTMGYTISLGYLLVHYAKSGKALAVPVGSI